MPRTVALPVVEPLDLPGPRGLPAGAVRRILTRRGLVPTPCTAVAVSPGGFRVAVGGGGQGRVRKGGPRRTSALRIFDGHDLTLLGQAEGPRGGASCMSFAPGGDALAVGGADGSLTLWVSDTGEQLGVLEARKSREPMRQLAFSPDGATLAGIGAGKGLRLWDWAAGELLRNVPNDGGLAVRLQLRWAHSGKRILVLSTNTKRTQARLVALDFERGFSAVHPEVLLERTLDLPPDGLLAFELSPDQRRLALRVVDTWVEVLDARQPSAPPLWRGDLRPLDPVRFVFDGDQDLVAFTAQGNKVGWRKDEPGAIRQALTWNYQDLSTDWVGGGPTLGQVALSSDGGHLAFVAHGALRLGPLDETHLTGDAAGQGAAGAALADEGRQVWVAAVASLRRLEVATGALVEEVRVARSSRGRSLQRDLRGAVAPRQVCADGTWAVVDAARDQTWVLRRRAHDGEWGVDAVGVQAAALAPGDRALAVLTGPGYLQVRDLRHDRVQESFTDDRVVLRDPGDGRALPAGEGTGRAALVFTPDATRLLLLSEFGSLDLWQVGALEHQQRLVDAGPDDRAGAVALHPRGEVVFVSCPKRGLRALEVHGGREVDAFPALGSPDGLAISACGTWLAVGGDLAGGDRSRVEVYELTGFDRARPGARRALRKARALPGHGGRVAHLAFGANGHLLSADASGEVVVWDLAQSL